MKKIIIIVIFCIVLLSVLCNKTELFANTTINLVDHDMYQIKDSIDKVAFKEYLDAIDKIGENYIKIIIDTFKKSLDKNNMKEQKASFESNSFIQAIFTNEKLALTDNFKQSLFMELSEAHLLNRNINMVPLRLFATDKIISKDGMNKITDNLQNIQLKKITTFFILYLLKYYDMTQPQHNKNDKILRFEKDSPSHEEINLLITKSNLFFD
jgi:hypothetical protein